ncbi:tannase/feruloyl esterase family alpha/beta hydrolase [Nonomuraea sp. NPDC026600]|uniref:tannase/feruloyl esterase family alpha/beta hydrolase n=1 Tax=Nonomuraea sp. NPDC026600 TaxID=3155363 RepID=UPI0033C438B1
MIRLGTLSAMIRLRALLAALAVLSMALPLNLPSAAAAESGTCESLTATTLPDATVTLAESVPAGRYAAPDGRILPSVPAFCRVHGIAKPVPGSTIGFEVWIPLQGWNQRLLMFGNGGYSSAVDFPSMGGSALAAGYATVGTDTGHTGDDPDVFVQGAANPEIIVDWGHRAVHETIVNAKPIVEAYTGSKPRYSYFIGCSTGGHQALMEAQRYPGDFDGIVAGDPGNNRVALNAGFLWQFLRNHTPGTPDPIIPAAKLPLLTNAAVRQCRGKDGGLAGDDFLTDPRRCSFDPASLRCPADDAPTCLTKRQVQTVRQMYAGARDPRTGRQIYPGWPGGSEAPVVDASGTVRVGWNGYWGTTAPARANFWRYWVFNDPDWNWWSFDFHRDLRIAEKKLGPIIDATDPNLEPFRRGGGKLIMYTGWADPVVSAYDTIDYYRQVVRATAGARGEAVRRTQEFARLFMVPGMTHCAGGPGPNVFDTLTPIVRWVERGAAPTEIVATKYVHDNPADGVALTRLLQPFTC